MLAAFLSTSLDWFYWLLLAVILAAGFFVNILGMPGLWLMLIGHILFALVTGWDNYTGWATVLTLFGIATLAEIVELIAGAAGSAKAGGSKRAMLAAIVGGFLGAILGSAFIPIAIPISTIVGAVAGSFIAAGLVEHAIHKDTTKSLKVGAGAAAGRLMGIVIKSGFGVVMIIISLITALPIGGSASTPPATLPTTTPTTLPTTAP